MSTGWTGGTPNRGAGPTQKLPALSRNRYAVATTSSGDTPPELKGAQRFRARGFQRLDGSEWSTLPRTARSTCPGLQSQRLEHGSRPPPSQVS